MFVWYFIAMFMALVNGASIRKDEPKATPRGQQFIGHLIPGGLLIREQTDNETNLAFRAVDDGQKQVDDLEMNVSSDEQDLMNTRDPSDFFASRKDDFSRRETLFSGLSNDNVATVLKSASDGWNSTVEEDYRNSSVESLFSSRSVEDFLWLQNQTESFDYETTSFPLDEFVSASETLDKLDQPGLGAEPVVLSSSTDKTEIETLVEGLDSVLSTSGHSADLMLSHEFSTTTVITESSEVEIGTPPSAQCPAPGFCLFWFMAPQDACELDRHCLGSLVCCQVGCSKSCV